MNERNEIISYYDLISNRSLKHKSSFCYTLTAYILLSYRLSNKNVGLLTRRDHRRVQQIAAISMNHHLSDEEIQEKSKTRPRTILIDSIFKMKNRDSYSTLLTLYTYFHRTSPYKTFDTNAFLKAWIMMCSIEAKERGIKTKIYNYKPVDIDINIFFSLCYSMREHSDPLSESNFATLSYSKKYKTFFAHSIVSQTNENKSNGSIKIMNYAEIEKYLNKRNKEKSVSEIQYQSMENKCSYNSLTVQ